MHIVIRTNFCGGSSVAPDLPHAPRRSAPRGMALFVVFLVVASAALIATSLAIVGRAETRSADTARHRAQARALAWSGVQAVMAELDSQRDLMLDGGTPEVVDAWSLYGTEAERGMIRLIPIEAERDDLLISESAKLDLNKVDAETLRRIPGLAPELADRIIAARGRLPGGRFQSIGDLLAVEGVTPAMLWGDPAEFRVQSAAAESDDDRGRLSERLRFMQRDLGSGEADLTSGGTNDLEGDSEGDGSIEGGSLGSESASTPGSFGDAPASDGPPLSRLLTVFNYEPVIQNSSRYRINFNAEFTPQMRSRIERRFGEDLANQVEQAKRDGTVLDEDTLFEVIAGFVAPDEWDAYIDGFTTSDAPFYHGRPDLNRAPAVVLAALPALTPDQAEQIVAVRDSLTDTDRAGTSWLAREGILTNDEWAAAAPGITWRSFVWRVRVMGQVLQGGLNEPTREAAHVVYEAVIDLSSPTPRIAYLRDITMLEPAGMLFGTRRGDALAAGPVSASGSTTPSSGGAANPDAAENEEDVDFAGRFGRTTGDWRLPSRGGNGRGSAYDASEGDPDDPNADPTGNTNPEDDGDEISNPERDPGDPDDADDLDSSEDRNNASSSSSSTTSESVRPLGRWTSGR